MKARADVFHSIPAARRGPERRAGPNRDDPDEPVIPGVPTSCPPVGSGLVSVSVRAVAGLSAAGQDISWSH